ncbi:MAG: hypothetical protein ACUVTO_05725 [Candidatus Caldatribacteriaceae bacterium]
MMDASWLKELHSFIVRAKQSTYAGGGPQLLPYRLGSHDLQFREGEWSYHDSYLGEAISSVRKLCTTGRESSGP